jgi:hypothetical protein
MNLARLKIENEPRDREPLIPAAICWLGFESLDLDMVA